MLIKSNVNHDRLPKIIAVSKTFPIENILPLVEYGHIHYGENKVQEALDKWSDIKSQNDRIKLHLIGKNIRAKLPVVQALFTPSPQYYNVDFKFMALENFCCNKLLCSLKLILNHGRLNNVIP